MRVLYLAALLIFSTLPANGSQQKKPTHSEQTTATNPKPTPLITESHDHPCTCKQADSADSQSRNWPPPWWSPFWPNYGVIAVGLLAALAALFTLSAIRSQNVGIGDNAAAAKLQAQAIINSERPWIVAEITRTIQNIPVHDPPQGDDYGMPIQKEQAYFSFSFKNIGKTPAEIISVLFTQLGTERGQNPPVPPNYGERSHMDQQRILAPGDSWPPQEAWSIPMIDQWRDEIENGERWYWRYGRIIYRNLLDGSEHNTKFCYLYFAPDATFIISGPPEYTGYD